METSTEIAINETLNDSVRPRPKEIPIEVAITLYSIIFFLAIVGNTLVILTLVQNKRMRTVTNVFLLNLAVSDLLLAVFCMPFTLIPVLIRNFIFGPFICVSIRYAQGVCVGANCFTLVAISLERYFAICRPLHSRRWQTLSHAYKIIGVCWITALAIAVPIAVYTRHVEIRPGLNACREVWPSDILERAYTVFLDATLLLIPLILMAGAYIRIMTTLYKDITIEDHSENGFVSQMSPMRKQSIVEFVSKKSGRFRSYVLKNVKTPDSSPYLTDRNYHTAQSRDISSNDSPCSSVSSTPRKNLGKSKIIRQTNFERNRKAKLRVVRMLFVVVVEFFVCWTPLYTLQTWNSFHHESINKSIDKFTWSAMFVLSYMSSCCNPITYCFMNQRFRNSFVAALRCCVFCRRNTSSLYSHSKYRSTTRQLTWADTNEVEMDITSVSRKGIFGPKL